MRSRARSKSGSVAPFPTKSFLLYCAEVTGVATYKIVVGAGGVVLASFPSDEGIEQWCPTSTINVEISPDLKNGAVVDIGI